MNIFFFTSSYQVGLTGQLTEQAISLARNTNTNFTFITGEREQFPGLFDKLNVAQVSYAIIPGLDDHADFGRLVREFKRHVEKIKPDYVTVQTNWQLAIAIAARALQRKKYQIQYVINGYRHNYRLRSYVARIVLSMVLYFFADDVVAPSSFLREKFSLLGRKSKVIFIGEDEALFQDIPLPDFSGTRRLVFPGEFRTGKNQDVLIRALKRYIESSNDRDIELYLPGRGYRLEYCKSLCLKLDLQDKVFFPGFINRSEMLSMYVKCQYALIASNVETFGHCIAEPFVLGRVVITRHVGIADDIIRHGDNGFLFDNESDLGDLLLSVLQDRALSAKVAFNARSERDKFRWDNVCLQYFDLIYKVQSK